MREYLVDRFMKSNIPKYHKYCNEWINNLTDIQLLEFEKERKRLWEKEKMHLEMN